MISARFDRRWHWAIVGVVAFGVACRLSQYAARTSLWHDEAFVALNAMHHDFIGFLGPIDFNDPSPPGFLAVERLLGAGLGYSEYALRLVPLLASIAALVAFVILARAIVSSPAAWFWSVLFAAVSAKLIEQSNLVKHFTLDFLLALTLTGLAIAVQRGRHQRTLLPVWGGLGAIGVWISYGAVFPFAGTSLVLLPSARTWPAPVRRSYVAANLFVLASGALLWFPIRAQWSDDLLRVWMHAFPDTTGAAALAYWFGRSLLGLFGFFWQPFGAVLLVLALIGIGDWWRTQHRTLLAFLWLPTALALAVSFVHAWPFGGYHQMVLATLPVFILAAEGIEVARRHRWATSRPRVGTVLVALLVLPGVLAAAYHLFVPRHRHEVRSVIESVGRRSEPGDALAVFAPAEFEFYTGRHVDPVDFAPSATQRVWVIGTYAHRELFPRQDFLDRLASVRPRLLVVEDFGAAAYLFGPEYSTHLTPNDTERAD